MYITKTKSDVSISHMGSGSQHSLLMTRPAVASMWLADETARFAELNRIAVDIGDMIDECISKLVCHNAGGGVVDELRRRLRAIGAGAYDTCALRLRASDWLCVKVNTHSKCGLNSVRPGSIHQICTQPTRCVQRQRTSRRGGDRHKARLFHDWRTQTRHTVRYRRRW